MKKFSIPNAILASFMLCSTTMSAAVISSLPEGAVSKDYTMEASVFTTFWGKTFPVEEDMLPSTVAFDGDKVYWYEPVLSVSQAYIVGEMKDGKIVFDFPQQVSSTAWLNRMVRTSEEGEEFAYAVDDSAPNQLTFDVSEDGTISMTEGDKMGSVILGYSNSAGKWLSDGVFGVNLHPFDHKLVEAPASLESSKWVMSYDGNSREVLAGFDGNDFYVKGLSDRCPSAWAKGTLADGKLTFASGQYMGIDRELGYRIQMFGADTEWVDNPSTGTKLESYILLDSYEMAYDETSGAYNAVTPFLVFCPGEVFKNMLTYKGFTSVSLRPAVEITDFTPAAPTITEVMTYPSMPNQGWDYMDVYLSVVNVEGQMLDTDNLYYRLILDGEPYILDPDDFEDLDEPMEWIPYTFTCYDLEDIGGTGRSVSIYKSFINEYAVQEKYDDGSREWLSEITVYGSTGISSAAKPDRQAVSETYYDLTGRKINTPSAGLYIKATQYSDGSVSTSKVSLK